jgi:hypothetical protein
VPGKLNTPGGQKHTLLGWITRGQMARIESVEVDWQNTHRQADGRSGRRCDLPFGKKKAARNMNLRTRYFTIMMVLLVVTGCLRSFRPIIYNGYDHPVILSLMTDHGFATEVTLESGQSVSAGVDKYDKLRQLMVMSTNRVTLMSYSEHNIRSNHVDGLWTINESGLHPIKPKK